MVHFSSTHHPEALASIARRSFVTFLALVALVLPAVVRFRRGERGASRVAALRRVVAVTRAGLAVALAAVAVARALAALPVQLQTKHGFLRLHSRAGKCLLSANKGLDNGAKLTNGWKEPRGI